MWIPYGNVETLVTLQAENLGTVVDFPPEPATADLERVNELLRGATAVFVCDSLPTSIELLKSATPSLEGQVAKVFASSPKRVEGAVPDLKGRVTTLPPPLPADDGGDLTYSPELMENGAKVFIGSARPDPLYGMLDTTTQACLSWVAGSKSFSAKSRKGMEPESFQKTEAYDVLQEVARKIPDSTFLTAIPRGGKLKTVLEGAPFDAIKNAFSKSPMANARGMIIGVGGRGYDDTLSSAIRGVWNVIEGVRRTGSILLIAECAEGVGSTALEMLVTGRLTEGERRRGKQVDGIEEVFYLSKLKDEYDVLLLSGLPETYAREKLGFTTAKGSGEAVGRILNKVGRSGKLNVVPRASECLLESG